MKEKLVWEAPKLEEFDLSNTEGASFSGTLENSVYYPVS